MRNYAKARAAKGGRQGYPSAIVAGEYLLRYDGGMSISARGPSRTPERYSATEHARLVNFYLRQNAVNSEMSLAEWLRKEFAQARAVDVAYELGIDPQSLKAWETGRSKPTGERAMRYLALLDDLWSMTQPDCNGEVTAK